MKCVKDLEQRDRPEDYAYINQIVKLTKKEAIELAKELGFLSRDEMDFRIYEDQKGKFYTDG